MIIVKLIGGLGNQLFQYALGRHLSEIHQTKLKIDVLPFKTYTLHRYSLRHFNIKENYASQKEVSNLMFQSQGVVQNIVSKLTQKSFYQNPAYISQNQLGFIPEILTLPDNLYLDGYWQSEKYFINISDIILKEFQIKYPIGRKNKHMVQKILETVSIGVHLRARDYYTNQKTNALHGIVSRMYYKKCLDYISTYLNKPLFFIFSDDPEYAKNYLGNIATGKNIIYAKYGKNYEDLTLMSLCKHQIIANSTFSWWAAWLNKNPDKLIFAPKQWFANKEFNNQTGDLIPNNWKRL